MTGIDAMLARIRAGEIVHARNEPMFAPLFDLFNSRLQFSLGTSEPLSAAFSALTWDRLEPALDELVSELDDSREHFCRLATALSEGGISCAEGLLQITLDKSMRLCLTGRHKKNYGYFVHRDSWFDLSPDGINIVMYLTDVPAHGNTQFYTQYFDRDTPYHPQTRRLLDESSLTRVTAYNCRAGDVLIFSGDHLHSGALCETDRLSIEFRLSRCWDFGRPDQGIVYRSLQDYVKPELKRVPASV